MKSIESLKEYIKLKEYANIDYRTYSKEELIHEIEKLHNTLAIYFSRTDKAIEFIVDNTPFWKEWNYNDINMKQDIDKIRDILEGEYDD